MRGSFPGGRKFRLIVTLATGARPRPRFFRLFWKNKNDPDDLEIDNVRTIPASLALQRDRQA